MRAPYEVLGLSPEASTADIKKAYARLLKQTRPEDDPAGFQRLQEAYEICIAHQKHLAARAKGPEGDHPAPPAPAPAEPSFPRSRIAPVAPPPPLPGDRPAPARQRPPILPEDTVRALLEEIVVAGERESPADLRRWLHSHDALVSLDVQRLLATRLPRFILKRKPRLDTDRLRVIYEYFLGTEFNSGHANPDLHRAWELVYARERFQRELASLRRRFGNWLDRLVFDELLMPASHWRRRALLAVPTVAGRIADRIARIRAIDANGAAEVLQPDALRFWSTFASSGGLSLRFVLLNHAQMIVGVAALVALLGTAAGLGLSDKLQMVAILQAILSVNWFAFQGIRIVNRRLELRRERLRAEGRVPGDALLTAAYVFCAICLAMAFGQPFSTDKGDSTAMTVVFAAIPLTMMVVSGRGRRWEMLALTFFGASAIGRTAALLLGAWLPISTILAFAASLGALAGPMADHWHARRNKVEPRVARRGVNDIAWKAAAVCFLVTLIGLFIPAPDSAADRIAIPATPKRHHPAGQRSSVLPDLSQLPGAGSPGVPTTKFDDAGQAFQAVRAEVAGAEVADTPYRAFHVSSGPLAGDWLFSGGDALGPDRMVHYRLPGPGGVREMDQVLCPNAGRSCRQFKEQAAVAPADLSRYDHQLDGGRLTWDSPGFPPEVFECPVAKLLPNEVSKFAAVPVRVLFNGAGAVVDAQLNGTSGSPSADSAVLTAAMHCKITASRREPGILRVTIGISAN